MHKLYTAFSKILKPRTAGARAILVREGKILLVKHTYLESWFIPGGGLKKNETYEQAIRRELQEELGITIFDLKLLGIYNNFYEGKSDSIVVFTSENFTEPEMKDKEIEDFRYFDPTQLPDKTSPGTRKRMDEYLNSNLPYYGLS